MARPADNPPPFHSLEERRSHILDLLAKHSSVSVSSLSKDFGISEVSVRKLLQKMESSGELRRTWGGAVAYSSAVEEFPLFVRGAKCIEEKKAIALTAYNCIEDGEAIFLDSGSSTLELARLIKNGTKRNILVATNAFDHALEFVAVPDIQTVFVGGDVRHSVRSCAGQFTREMIEQMYFDRAFIGIEHISTEYGFTSPNMREVEIKRAAIRSANYSYVLADHTKFRNNSLIRVATLSQVNAIITDWHLTNSTKNEYEDFGIKIITSKAP